MNQKSPTEPCVMTNLIHHKLKGMAGMKEIKMYIQIQELKELGFGVCQGSCRIKLKNFIKTRTNIFPNY